VIEEEDKVGCERFLAKAAGRGDLATLATLIETAGCTGGVVQVGLNSVLPPPDGAELEGAANSANGVSVGVGASDCGAPTATAAAAAAAAAASSTAAASTTDITINTDITNTTDVTTTTALKEAVRMKQWAAVNYLLANGAAKAAGAHASGGFGPDVIRWQWDSADLSSTVASVHFAKLLLGHDWIDAEAASGTSSSGGGGGSDGTQSAVAHEKPAAMKRGGPSAVRVGAAPTPPPVASFIPVMDRPGGSLLKVVWGALMAGSNATVAMVGGGGGPALVPTVAAPALAAMAPTQFRISGVLGAKLESQPNANGHVGPAASQMDSRMGGGMRSAGEGNGIRSRMGGSRMGGSRMGGSRMGGSRSADSRSAGGMYGGSRVGGMVSAAGNPQRLPTARPVDLGGAPVAAAGATLANGTFAKHPDELMNGKPVFYKVVDSGEASEPSFGQVLGAGADGGVAERVCCWYNRDEVWMVGPERHKKANCEFGYAHPVAKGLPHPAVPGVPWTVSTTRGWMAMKPSEVTAAVTVGVDVAAHAAWFEATWAMLAATTKLYLEGCVETARSDDQTQLMRATYVLSTLVLTYAFVCMSVDVSGYRIPRFSLCWSRARVRFRFLELPNCLHEPPHHDHDRNRHHNHHHYHYSRPHHHQHHSCHCHCHRPHHYHYHH
jgi:hypothetical protein